ncbi:MAG: ketopantoate reductase family protein [Gammaproteobacteria bacterium]|nr:ketopantoate reductase family protein [Gammaproteobacteria bacterium]
MNKNPTVAEPIHILGAGGIGLAIAWCLLRDDKKVILVDNNEAKIVAGQKDGMEIVGHGTEAVEFVHFDDWDSTQGGLVLLCTKTYDNAAVLNRLHDESLMVPVQNGFDTELDKLNHAGEGIASFVSECLRDRPVTRITRPGCLHIGSRRKTSDAERAELKLLGESIDRAKLFPVEFVNDVLPYKATKLMYNAAISPLAAGAGVDNGELLGDSIANKLFFALLLENYAILKNAGMALAKIGPFHPDTVSRILTTPFLPALMSVFFRPSLKGTYCSMAPDMASGRTEIEAYNGHLIRLAGDFPCPLNRAALKMINTIVKEKLPVERRHLQDLADSLPIGVLS